MEFEEINEIIKKHKKKLSEDISLEDLDKAIDDIILIKNSNLNLKSKDEAEILNESIKEIMEKVKILKSKILSELSDLENKGKAVKSYIKNQYKK